MNDWRELLCRVLDGESISEEQAEALLCAFADEENCREAAAWIQFEETVLSHWRDNEAMADSRERLLAKAILREKHEQVVEHGIPMRTVSSTQEFQPNRLLHWGAIGVIAGMLLIAAFFLWPSYDQQDAYAQPLAQGDFHILGPATELSRGERLFSGGEGAQLALGGYCNLNLMSHTDVTLFGAPHREAIELHQGGLRARITPNQGEFRVMTPLGQVNVNGTEFETSVEYPNGLPGDLSMNGATKKVIVTVAVISGAVLCELGGSPVLLKAGASQAFAGEADNNSTNGEVESIADFSVTLKTDDGSNVFHASEENKLVVHEIGQLVKGDAVTISWVEEEGRRWIRDIDGEGVVEGRVTALGDAWIEVQASDRKFSYRAPWRGGNPADGGGPDREVVRKLGGVRVGDDVVVTWAMPEGKRVMDVVVRKRGQQSSEAADQGDFTKAPPELYGLSGRVIGLLAGKDVEKGELTLKIVKVDRVWRGNKAQNPQSAEGRTLKIEGVFGKFLDVLLTLKTGDGVQIEVKHVRGDGLTFLGEELKKVEIEEEPQPDREGVNETTDNDSPPGLQGFRGILIGELVSKDIEMGTLVFKMEKVQRVWKANKAPAPEKSKGQLISVEGVSGKFLDTLLVLQPGDRIEVEAFHVRGKVLNFPGEWLKKAE